MSFTHDGLLLGVVYVVDSLALVRKQSDLFLSSMTGSFQRKTEISFSMERPLVLKPLHSVFLFK
jgi:hypothetical protein